MSFANDHDVIKAFSSDRADQTFAIVHSATANVGRLVDRECPWREDAA